MLPLLVRYKTVFVQRKKCPWLFSSSISSVAFLSLPASNFCHSSSCMAANLRQRGFACLGKRFVERSWIGGSKDPAAPLSAFRRNSVVHSHFSAYDKNPDEAVHPAAVPDDVIQPPDSSDKYWAPHPDTGVFGPSEQNSVVPAASGRPAPAAAAGSVLEEKAWFRPLEDVDKPQPS